MVINHLSHIVYSTHLLHEHDHLKHLVSQFLSQHLKIAGLHIVLPSSKIEKAHMLMDNHNFR